MTDGISQFDPRTPREKAAEELEAFNHLYRAAARYDAWGSVLRKKRRARVGFRNLTDQSNRYRWLLQRIVWSVDTGNGSPLGDLLVEARQLIQEKDNTHG